MKSVAEKIKDFNPELSKDARFIEKYFRPGCTKIVREYLDKAKLSEKEFSISSFDKRMLLGAFTAYMKDVFPEYKMKWEWYQNGTEYYIEFELEFTTKKKNFYFSSWKGFLKSLSTMVTLDELKKSELVQWYIHTL